MSLYDKLRAILGGQATVATLDIDDLRKPVARAPAAPPTVRRAPVNVEVTDEFRRAVAVLEAGAPVVFVTGRAGTGKSTFIRYIQDQRAWASVTCAPTGIAALNCRGQTIHSLFHLPAKMIDPSEIRATPRNESLFRNLQLLILDEASMLRADTLDIIDLSLRKWRRRYEPFGGVQVLFVGDLLQLPPVVTDAEEPFIREKYRSPWFFSAHVMRDLPVVTIELTKVFRQSDQHFIDILSKIRMNEDHRESVAELNRRCYRDAQNKTSDLILTTTNRQADGINQSNLERLETPARKYRAVVEGDFSVKGGRMPAPEELVLKVGAQVMVVKNTSGAVNGTLATVVEMTDTTVTVRKLRGGKEDDIVLSQEVWEDHRYSWSEGERKIVSNVVGRYKQIPVRLAYACTVHKSQGMTLESVKIDLGSGAFAEGQTYVALSRVRSIDGLTLARPIGMKDVIADEAVVEFYRRQAKARTSSTL